MLIIKLISCNSLRGTAVTISWLTRINIVYLWTHSNTRSPVCTNKLTLGTCPGDSCSRHICPPLLHLIRFLYLIKTFKRSSVTSKGSNGINRCTVATFSGWTVFNQWLCGPCFSSHAGVDMSNCGLIRPIKLGGSDFTQQLHWVQLRSDTPTVSMQRAWIQR